MFAKMMIQKAVEFLTNKVDENNGKLEIDVITCNKWLSDNHPDYKLSITDNGVDISNSVKVILMKKL